MSFHLEELPYQRRAIDAVLRIFKGQMRSYCDVVTTYRTTEPTPRQGLYDHVILDADSNPERGFAKEADLHPQVRCLLKLPDCYKIPEPSMGGGASSYTPDFGIVVTHRGLRDDAEIELHLVVETKSTEVLEELSAEEQIKIRCAVKHFEALGIAANTGIVFRGPMKEMPKKVGEGEATEYRAAVPGGFFAPRVRFADTLDRAVETK